MLLAQVSQDGRTDGGYQFACRTDVGANGAQCEQSVQIIRAHYIFPALSFNAESPIVPKGCHILDPRCFAVNGIRYARDVMPLPVYINVELQRQPDNLDDSKIPL